MPQLIKACYIDLRVHSNVAPSTYAAKAAGVGAHAEPTYDHFFDKLLKLKGLMRTGAGRERAEERHEFMEGFSQACAERLRDQEYKR